MDVENEEFLLFLNCAQDVKFRSTRPKDLYDIARLEELRNKK